MLILAPFIVHEVVRGGFVMSPAPGNLDVIDGKIDGKYTHHRDGSGVNVYMLDTGIDFTHPLFANVSHRFGTDFIDPNGAGGDMNGHGTHTSGIVVQVSSGVTLIDVRVFDQFGRGTENALLAAVYWVNNDCALSKPKHGCVINYSGVGLGIDSEVNYAVANTPVAFIGAAGNYAGNACLFSPGRSATLLVAATYNNRTWWNGSDPGRCVSLSAPGVEIMSAFPNGTWATLTGTSMSDPHVTGVFAQFIQTYPHRTKKRLSNGLLRRATHSVVGEPEWTSNRFIRVPV